MILGIGTDIIEVKRIALAITRRGAPFLDRLFTPDEQHYCLQHSTSERNFAGRFAAKEAVAKALGLGITQKLSWLDIEIGLDPLGKPIILTSEKLKPFLEKGALHISISHCKE